MEEMEIKQDSQEEEGLQSKSKSSKKANSLCQAVLIQSQELDKKASKWLQVAIPDRAQNPVMIT